MMIVIITFLTIRKKRKKRKKYNNNKQTNKKKQTNITVLYRLHVNGKNVNFFFVTVVITHHKGNIMII